MRRRVGRVKSASEEEPMYTAIRRYEGVADTGEVARRATEGFAPQLRDQSGFIGYWVVDAGDGVLATISVFESEEAANDSTTAAAAWIRENIGDLVPNPPQVTAGATTGIAAEATA
jgi:hypothetical protein